jgi:hypothetical protein
MPMYRWVYRLLALFALAVGCLPAPGYAQSPVTTSARGDAAPGVAAPAANAPASGNAQGRANAGDLLTAASLTEADVPRGLALDRNRGGLRTGDNGALTYTIAFVADGSGDRTLMGVLNQLGQYPDAATGMDAVTERYRTNLSGNRTELPPPAVGDASRAFTVTSSAMGGAMSTTTAVVALRRADVVASVAVATLGSTPQVDMAVSLAQAVDRRLTAAIGGGP